MDGQKLEIWLVAGSQHLYGPETLDKVAEHAAAVADGFTHSTAMPVRTVAKPVMTTAEAIHRLCLEANAASNCVGIVAWMHTFSPAKMWLAGLRALQKPLAHLHTQFNRELPWAAIDMDFMNLNQSAHGDREFGFAVSRLRMDRKVIVGHWQDREVIEELAAWARAAAAWHDAQSLKVARFGDNMRQVAVTEGDKVEAQIRLRYTVNGYGMGDLVRTVEQVTDAATDKLVSEYEDRYAVAPSLRPGGEKRDSLRQAARLELGLRAFLQEQGCQAFTDTFEDLHGLPQLPGIAVQRLMNDGYGFGAEGDWKTAALVRAMKVMGAGLPGGASFMEDYTYDWRGEGQVLGAHMLEVCPSIAATRPSAEIHPLGIGGKADPVRLVFATRPGPAVNATVVDMGDRFRMIVNAVQVVPSEPLPKLPVASAVWVPEPNLKIGAAAWILAGGAHHTGFSQALTPEHLENFAAMAGLEFVLIDRETNLRRLQQELRWNDLYYRFMGGRA